MKNLKRKVVLLQKESYLMGRKDYGNKIVMGYNIIIGIKYGFHLPARSLLVTGRGSHLAGIGLTHSGRAEKSFHLTGLCSGSGIRQRGSHLAAGCLFIAFT